MGLYIQNKLIQFILQPFCEFTNHFSERTKKRVFVFSVLLIFVLHFIYHTGRFPVRYLYLFSADCVMAGLMLLASLPARVEPLRFYRPLACLWFATGLLMLLAGVSMEADYLPETVLFLIVYPVCYIVWNSGDFQKIMQWLMDSCRWSFFLYCSVNLLLFPITDAQYPGFFSNVNGAAIYLALVFCCCFVRILAYQKVCIGFFLDLVLLGASVAFCFYSNSRTGEMAMAAVALLTTMLLIATRRGKFWSICLRRLLPMALSVMLLIPGVLLVSDGVQQIRTEVMQSIEKEPTVSPEEEQTPPPKTDTEILDSIVAVNQDKTTAAEKTLDQYSSGRISIWREYCKHLGFWGHSGKETFYVEARGTNNSTAHLTVLDFAYQFGVLAGLLYLVFNLGAGVRSVRYALCHPKDAYALAPFVISVAFGVMSLFNSFTTSFYTMAVFYYYLVQTPLMNKELK